MAANIYTALAPVNIAVIKYWGKRDEDLILPVNDSISVTLSKNKMCAKTTVACSAQFESDRIWLNGKEQDINSSRLQNCIREIKRLAKKKELLNCHLHICSENNFPTAAGLASSAAGFSCLVKALAALYGVDADLTRIARQGSGSACRSMLGGFVHWSKGSKNDGSDSVAHQIARKEHWPELKVMILVVKSDKKATSSTDGMQRTVLTSSLLKYRILDIVPKRIEEITKAIMLKDFQTFSEITMKESNQFHAVCLDTYPPIHYLNATSYKIMELVHSYNKLCGRNKVAYTFDAGCNACLYLLEDDVPEIIALLKYVFPPEVNDSNFIRGLDACHCDISRDFIEKLNFSPCPGLLQYIINTQVGNGPILIEDSQQHLLNAEGLPF